MALYPLKFHPLMVEKIWGGRKIETVLGKPLPPGKRIGESWEIYDFQPGYLDVSQRWVSAVLANGPLRGRTLHELILEFGDELMGDVQLTPPHGQFPLLAKYLDAQQDLSIQVHPDEAFAAAHDDAYLKNEAWYVVQSDPGGKILKGLVPGIDRETLRRAIEEGNVEHLLRTIEAKPGRCIYLPSGTIHALCAGVLAAEVQTPSDTTFRVYDYNRIDPDTGQPRKLHIEQALDCINYAGDEPPQRRSHVGSYFTTVTRLITCPYFKLEKVRMTEGVEEPVPYDQPVVWMMLEGEAQITVKNLDDPVQFGRGETLLLPASMQQPIIKTLTDCVWLEATFPVKPELS